MPKGSELSGKKLSRAEQQMVESGDMLDPEKVSRSFEVSRVGRPRMSELQQHRWWRRKLQVMRIVGGERQLGEVPDPFDEKDNEDPGLHWICPDGPTWPVEHGKQRRGIRVMLYREFGPDASKLRDDPMGWMVTAGGTDLPGFGCGVEDCVNPWHCEVVEKSIWLRAMSEKGRVRRHNMTVNRLDEQIVTWMETRSTVRALADSQFVLMCFESNLLDRVEEDGNVRLKAGLPSEVRDEMMAMIYDVGLSFADVYERKPLRMPPHVAGLPWSEANLLHFRRLIGERIGSRKMAMAELPVAEESGLQLSGEMGRAKLRRRVPPRPIRPVRGE